MGGNWLARVGVVAIVFGVVFFLKLAIDNDWLGPTARVVLGVVVGGALLIAGEYWRRKYGPFAQALSGGGIAILYVSIFAAHAMYGLIGVYVSTGFLLLISVTSAGLALRYGAISLAVIGILGAFSAPLLLLTSQTRDELIWSGVGLDLLAYIIVVDVGALALSTHRNWRWMTILAWVGSMSLYLSWSNTSGDHAGFLIAQTSLTLIYLSFVATTVMYHVVLGRASNHLDHARMVVNALSYFGVSYSNLTDDFDVLTGALLAQGMAVFYGGLAYAALLRSRNGEWFSLVSLGTAGALSFIGIGFFIWSDRLDVLTGALLAQGMAVFYGGLAYAALLRSRNGEWFSLVSLGTAGALSFIGIGFFIWSDRLDALTGALIALTMAVFYGGLAYAALRRGQNGEWLSMASAGIALTLLTLAPFIQFGDSAWTTVTWAAQGAALIWVSFLVAQAGLRYFGYAVFCLVALRLIVFDTPVYMSTYNVILNERMLAFSSSIAAIYLVAFLLWRHMKMMARWEREDTRFLPVFLTAGSLCTLWVLGAEIFSGFDEQIAGLSSEELGRGVADGLRNAKNLSITALLSLYAAALLVTGVWGRWRMVRLAALALMAIAIGKVFVYDVFTLETIYRILAFVGLGTILVIGGYMYQRLGKTLVGFLTEE